MTDLFATAESPQTDAAVSLVSGSRQLERAILGLAVTRDLMAEGRRDAGLVSAIVERVGGLVGQPADRRYANPADAALTVYLFVLSRLASDEVVVAAALASKAPNCFWAPRVAEAILTSLARSRAYRFWLADTAFRSDADHGDSATSVLSAPRGVPGDPSHLWTPRVAPSDTRVVGSGSLWTSVGSGSRVSLTAAA